MLYYTKYKQNLNTLSTCLGIRNSLGYYRLVEDLRGHGKVDNHVAIPL